MIYHRKLVMNHDNKGGFRDHKMGRDFGIKTLVTTHQISYQLPLTRPDQTSKFLLIFFCFNHASFVIALLFKLTYYVH
jgi:hypothetical protein